MVFFVISARGKVSEEAASKTMSKALLIAHTNDDISCGAQRRSFGFGAFP